MRILHIMASKALGGAETYSTDVMLSLHQAGIDQCIVMSKDAPRYGELKKAGLRVVSEPLAVPFVWLQKILMRRLIKKEQPAIVQSWMRRGAALVGQAQRERTPLILGWFGGYYNVKKFKNCSHLIGVTKDIVTYMVAHGVPEPQAHFIPTFPDISPANPVDRRSLSTPHDAKILLALSRLHPKKGLDTLLMALQQLPDCVAWLAGDGPLRDELHALATKLSVMDRVRFLGWRTDRSALLRAADVCVLPSRYEPFGTVILEAWAAKTVFVACASAGPAARIEDGITGLLTPIDDGEALAKALRRVLDDRDLRDRLISRGYDVYVKNYTREAVTQQWIDFYKSLIG
jgi:glycosyltransferase involved in cell wall biosynthesis